MHTVEFSPHRQNWVQLLHCVYVLSWFVYNALVALVKLTDLHVVWILMDTIACDLQAREAHDTRQLRENSEAIFFSHFFSLCSTTWVFEAFLYHTPESSVTMGCIWLNDYIINRLFILEGFWAVYVKHPRSGFPDTDTD